MEYKDYSEMTEAMERVVDAAEPCEDCGRLSFLAIMVITSLEDHGELLLYCTACHKGTESSRAVGTS